VDRAPAIGRWLFIATVDDRPQVWRGFGVAQPASTPANTRDLDFSAAKLADFRNGQTSKLPTRVYFLVLSAILLFPRNFGHGSIVGSRSFIGLFCLNRLR
jgi:hypothetical protein